MNWYIIIKFVLIKWTLQSTFRCYICFGEICPKSFWFSCKCFCIFLQTGRKRKPRNTGRNSCWRNWWKLSTSETRWFSIWTHRRERTYLIPASQGSNCVCTLYGYWFFPSTNYLSSRICLMPVQDLSFLSFWSLCHLHSNAKRIFNLLSNVIRDHFQMVKQRTVRDQWLIDASQLSIYFTEITIVMLVPDQVIFNA